MAKTISIFKSLTRISAGGLTYGANSGGARIFEGLFIDHTLDANNNAMSRYQASGRIVQMAIQGESSQAAHTIEVAIRQGSAGSPTNTLWDMSAGAKTNSFGGASAGGCGLVLRPKTDAEAERKGVVALPSNGIAFNVNTDAQSPDAEDLYVFIKAGNNAVADCTVRIDVELDHSRGSLKPHKRARFLGTSSGAMH